MYRLVSQHECCKGMWTHPLNKITCSHYHHILSIQSHSLNTITFYPYNHIFSMQSLHTQSLLMLPWPPTACPHPNRNLRIFDYHATRTTPVPSTYLAVPRVAIIASTRESAVGVGACRLFMARLGAAGRLVAFVDVDAGAVNAVGSVSGDAGACVATRHVGAPTVV